jgi:hypothetical protein
VNEDDARSLVSQAMVRGINRAGGQRHSLSSDILDGEVDKLLSIWEQQSEVAATPGRIGAILPKNYVIPDQDLKLIETGFSVLTAAAAAGYFLPDLGFSPAKSLAAAITVVLIAVLRLLHNLKLSVHLDDLDYAIVTSLAGAREAGLSAEELLTRMHSLQPKLSLEQLEEKLNVLTACPNVGGTKSAIAWKDNQDQWRANGV